MKKDRDLRDLVWRKRYRQALALAAGHAEVLYVLGHMIEARHVGLRDGDRNGGSDNWDNEGNGTGCGDSNSEGDGSGNSNGDSGDNGDGGGNGWASGNGDGGGNGNGWNNGNGYGKR